MTTWVACVLLGCGPTGSGGPDAGHEVEAGVSDAGTMDAGPGDAGTMDAGPGDAGTTPCGAHVCTATQVCDVSYPGVAIDGGPQGPYYDGCVDAPAACFMGFNDAGCGCFGSANPCPGGGSCLFFMSPHVLVCE
jgi:hypothetical protein